MKQNMAHPKFIVGVGASAGGLQAYMSFLDALATNTGMAFVLLSHMYPSAQSLLAEILSSHTKMPVKVASEAMPILANHVYVNPPNSDLRMENYAFKVVSPRTQSNKQVDFFLISLAAAMGERAIAIILSGFDGDGTEGCKHIKLNGGRTFAQDGTAKIDHMPRSAQVSGYVDFVLPPDKMADELLKLASVSL